MQMAMSNPDQIREALRDLPPGADVTLALADGSERRGIYRGFDGSWVHLGDERITGAEVEGVSLNVASQGRE